MFLFASVWACVGFLAGFYWVVAIGPLIGFLSLLGLCTLGFLVADEVAYYYMAKKLNETNQKVQETIENINKKKINQV